MKNVVISGGAGGIGSEIVKKFLDKDFFVFILDNNENLGLQLANQYKNVKFVKIDLLTDDLSQLLKEDKIIKNGLNYLVLSSGRALKEEWGDFKNQDFSAIKKSIQLNLISHLELIHTLIPIMEETKEDKAITLISSINAQGNFGLPIYSSAKAGMYGFVKSITEELGKSGIRINTISPGTVITPETLKEAKNFDDLLKTTKLNKFVTPEDVAKLVLMISNEITSITGQDFIIDCGQII